VDVVIGRVLGVHIDERFLSKEGKLDVKLTEPIARLGYYDYAVVRDTFEMRVPNTSVEMLAGLEGSTKGNRELREKLAREAEVASKEKGKGEEKDEWGQ
jgi:hypothetical protein